jgi:hypothetical protein
MFKLSPHRFALGPVVNAVLCSQADLAVTIEVKLAGSPWVPRVPTSLGTAV